MSVTRISKFEAKDEMGDKLYLFLKSIVPLIEQAPGSESCRVLRSQDKPSEFLVIEVWASVAAHQASVKSIPPEMIAQVMPLLANPPGGSYYDG